jgi:hypothetical protein
MNVGLLGALIGTCEAEIPQKHFIAAHTDTYTQMAEI